MTVTGTIGARQLDRRSAAIEPGRRHDDDAPHRDRRRGRRASASTVPAHRRHRRCSTSWPPARRGAHGARRAHGRVRLRARHAAASTPTTRTATTTARATTPIRPSDELQAGRLRPAAVPGLSTPATGSSSGVRTRDLTPTFGSPLGAQLVDVYVHDPGARRRPRPRRRSRSATTRSRRRAPGAG